MEHVYTDPKFDDNWFNYATDKITIKDTCWIYQV